MQVSEFNIGGYDPRVLENVEYLKELSALATEYKFKYHVWNIDSPTPKNTQILFLPSFSDAQRTFLLSNAQCLLYTPSNEHFGIVPVEAMYAGLPVIAVNNGGPTETILDTETGFLCESDPSAFADAISKLIKSPNEKKVLGAHGRKHVKEAFSLDSFTNSLEEIVYGTIEIENLDALFTFYTFALTISLIFPIITILLIR